MLKKMGLFPAYVFRTPLNSETPNSSFVSMSSKSGQRSTKNNGQHSPSSAVTELNTPHSECKDSQPRKSSPKVFTFVPSHQLIGREHIKVMALSTIVQQLNVEHHYQKECDKASPIELTYLPPPPNATPTTLTSKEFLNSPNGKI